MMRTGCIKPSGPCSSVSVTLRVFILNENLIRSCDRGVPMAQNGHLDMRFPLARRLSATSVGGI